MSIDAATKKKIIDEYATERRRHGFSGGPGRHPHQADRAPHRAPQRAQARPPQPSWPDAAASANGAGCSTTSPRPTSSATGRSSNASGCVADRQQGSALLARQTLAVPHN